MTNLSMKEQAHSPLTPCAGRCSTVFGDSVCRGCRRFNHEVIYWNRYSDAEKAAIWQRLDAQLDQILVPMIEDYNLNKLMHFLQHKRVRLMPDASLGRKLYHALKLCEKVPSLTNESGLGLSCDQIKVVWDAFEQRILALAQASYELAWLRANFIHKNVNDRDDESFF